MKAKQAAYDFVHADTKSALYNFTQDPHWGDVYLPAIVNKGEMPSPQVLKEKLDKDPKNELLKNAYEKVNAIPSEVRQEFNAKLKAAIVAANNWARAAKALDKDLTRLSKLITDNESSTAEIKEANEWSMAPVLQRKTIMKVYGNIAAINKLNAVAEETADDFQEIKDKEEKGAIAGIIITILVLAIVIGSVVYCKCNKKLCFEEKEEGVAEGGLREDRTLFKREVRSKNAHKRHTKESLVPAFKVAEEEA